MKYEEFVEKIEAEQDDMFCPFDGIWCERSSCADCKCMKREYEKKWKEA